MEAENYEVSTSVFKSEHIGLKEEFIQRVRHLLNQEQEIKSYAVKAEFGMEVEQVELIVNGFNISIRVSK